MFDAYSQNDLLLSMLTTIAGEKVDLKVAEKAFAATRGDFRAKFTAAMETRMAQLAVPEVFVELPLDPAVLLKADLEKLVRPVAASFLRSHPSKDELLDQATRIRLRQERRPAWIPRLDTDRRPIPSRPSSGDDETPPERLLVVATLPELGEVTVRLPESWAERPELSMSPGGIGEWEAALFALLGVAGEPPPSETITIDASANEALVPEDVRWWSATTPRSMAATEDCGVASELLATSDVLGGVRVTDDCPEARDVVAEALLSAGDWRYSPRWSLTSWTPGDGTPTASVARAAMAGWANEHRSGVLIHVYGGAASGSDGLFSTPMPLHSYLLAVTRSAQGDDTVEAVHRIALSCPGEQWCHGGGCPDVDFFEASVLLTPIVTAGHAAEAAAAEEYFRLFYGDGNGDGYPDTVLEQLSMILLGAGWVELEESEWEGGVQESLLRRGAHCVLASYDPVTRQVCLADGRNELELTLDLLSDDGILGDDGIDHDAGNERWNADLLTAADDYLKGRLSEVVQLATAIQVTVVGLHPSADGTLRGPLSAELAERQLHALACTAGLLTPVDGEQPGDS
ncbi:hypothetical protein OG205_45525 [Lentzea sp. NBC_00516]|uniref:hypothetical protein n=1 Tax=Lentzea sp. NBC_00516 TaxID=2903582 RepID=UPI002E808D23|nr:hypothetical protein [Lentzea sp. NBC_00516]WUD25199.1 hypothetical protein OG205_45525 [Lentzea sp. NBC_00516]